MNAKLLNQITDHLTPLDTEDMYRTMLEDCYGEIKVAGLTFSAARIVEELDPTAFRCGVSDYIDSLSLVEIQGDYYEKDAVGAERDSLISDLESEIEDLENEILEIEKDVSREVLSESDGICSINSVQLQIACLLNEIKELEKHSF